MTTPTEKPSHAAPHDDNQDVANAHTVLEKPCCTRIVDELANGWCILPVNHDGACQRGPVSFGPQRPPPDRKIMSVFRDDISLKWHHSEAKRAEWLMKWGLVS